MLLESGFKIRPFDGFNPGRLRNDARHDTVPFSEFNDLARFKPCEELARVAELTSVYTGHVLNVSHCQPNGIGPTPWFTRTAAPLLAALWLQPMMDRV
jgi:hypothetical protein